MKNSINKKILHDPDRRWAVQKGDEKSAAGEDSNNSNDLCTVCPLLDTRTPCPNTGTTINTSGGVSFPRVTGSLVSSANQSWGAFSRGPGGGVLSSLPLWAPVLLSLAAKEAPRLIEGRLQKDSDRTLF